MTLKRTTLTVGTRRRRAAAGLTTIAYAAGFSMSPSIAADDGRVRRVDLGDDLELDGHARSRSRSARVRGRRTAAEP